MPKPRSRVGPKARRQASRFVAVQRRDVDLDALVRRVVRAANGRAGAVTTFTGFVRADKLGASRVRAIDYEAFDEMAAQSLARIRDAAVARFGLVDCRIVHRTGTLRVGQPSVFVVCAAAHRAATQDAAAWVMDEIKRAVPVWKRERAGGTGGRRGRGSGKATARWVEGHGPGAATRLPEARLPFG